MMTHNKVQIYHKNESGSHKISLRKQNLKRDIFNDKDRRNKRMKSFLKDKKGGKS